MTTLFVLALPNSSLTTLFSPQSFGGVSCGVDGNPAFLGYTDLAGNGECIAACPTADAPVPPAVADLVCKTGYPNTVAAGADTSNPAMLVFYGDCLPEYTSVDFLSRCIPTSPLALSAVTDGLASSAATSLGIATFQNSTLDLTSTMDYMAQFSNDLYHSLPVTFGIGIGGAFVLGFVFLLLFRVRARAQRSITRAKRQVEPVAERSDHSKKGSYTAKSSRLPTPPANSSSLRSRRFPLSRPSRPGGQSVAFSPSPPARSPFSLFSRSRSLLLSFPLMLGALGYFFYSLDLDYSDPNSATSAVTEAGAGDAADAPGQWQETACFVTAIVLWVLAGLSFCFLIFVRKSVALSIQCTRVTARTITTMPGMTLYARERTERASESSAKKILLLLRCWRAIHPRAAKTLLLRRRCCCEDAAAAAQLLTQRALRSVAL
jgi:hypothetical protein